jgi:formate dehydrogenase maturation protein FdhE
MSAALLAQLYALRAQVDAVIVAVQEHVPQPAPPLDPADTCPTCGATGDAVLDTSTLDGTSRRLCSVCRSDWVL